MHQVIRCPNCQATLERHPGEDDTRCDYCGAAIIATARPQPESEPDAPAGARPRASGTAVAVVFIVLALVLVLLTVAIIIDSSAATDDTGAAAEVAVSSEPVRLPVVAALPGQWARADLPLWSPGASGPVITAFRFDVPAAGLYAVETRSSSTYSGCPLALLDASGQVLARREGRRPETFFPWLAQGTVFFSHTCDPSTVIKHLEARFHALPALAVGRPLPLVFEPGAKELSVMVTISGAGKHAFALEADDISDRLKLHDAAGNLLGEQAMSPSAMRAILDADLQPGVYRVSASRVMENRTSRRVAFAVHRNDPVTLVSGHEFFAELSRYVDNRHHLFDWTGQPVRIEARLATQMKTAHLEIFDAQDVRIASAMSFSGRGAVAATKDPVPAGRYRIVVRSPSHEVNTGQYRLMAQPVQAAGR